ncbi:MAG: hypothetical protein Q8L87_05665 [Anaerolineales bacterium]|nr:hypothetical protein [Anaerolineales bacterium]
MMIIIPVISFAAGYETINYGIENNWAIPYQLLGTPQFPDFFYRSSGIMALLSPIASVRNFYGYLAAGLFYMIMLGGITSVAYAIVYRITGPSRYGPLDVPAPNIKVKRYKR